MQGAFRIGIAVVLAAAVAVAADELAWLARGRPTQQIDVSVITAMELKGQKEDYGEPETRTERCERRLIPLGSSPACWWLSRHRELIQRF